jgi:4'-phosphopantetheinyl transferase
MGRVARVVVHTVSLVEPAVAAPTAAELERAARIVRPDVAARWLAARAALRAVLGERLGVEPGDVAFVTGEHGKPELPGTPLRFNLSHSGEIAVIALAEGAEVGVDVERTARSSKAIPRTLTAGERAAHPSPGHLDLLRIWCRKEALAKAIGTGLGWTPEAFDTARPEPYALTDLQLSDGYVGAVAAHARELEVTVGGLHLSVRG